MLGEPLALRCAAPVRYAKALKGVLLTSKATPVKTRVSYRNLTFATLVAAAGALLINVLLYFLGRLFGAFPPTVQVQGQPFSVVSVIVFSFFPVVVAALVFLLLVRFTAQPKRIFYIVAAVIFALMIFTPFTLTGAPRLSVAILELMHIVVAAGSVWAVSRA